MILVGRIAAAFVLCLSLVAPAAAEALAGADLQALSDRAALFEEATRTSNVADTFALMPPKALEKLARAYATSPAPLAEAMQQQMNEALKSLKVESVELDLSAPAVPIQADTLRYLLSRPR